MLEHLFRTFWADCYLAIFSVKLQKTTNKMSIWLSESGLNDTVNLTRETERAVADILIVI